MNRRILTLLHYVIPTVLSNSCFFLFTVVDAIFIGRGIGTNGLGSMGIVGPFVMIVGAVMMLTAVGGVTIFAICIGRHDLKEANRLFTHTMVLLIGACSVLSFAGVFLTSPLCRLLGAGETFFDMSSEYMFWYSLFIIPYGISYGLQAFGRNDGSPGLVGVSVFFSTALNIYLDWLFIFPKHMGMKGAAIATGISQIAALIIILWHYVMKKGIIRFSADRLCFSYFIDIVKHGLPEGVNQFAMPLTTLWSNLMLVKMVGDIGVNAFTIISYIAAFSMSVFTGTSEGLQPLFGQCYGAGDINSQKFYFRSGLFISVTGSIIVTACAALNIEPICLLFGTDAATTDFIIGVFPQFSVGFIAMAVNIMICTYLYSTERTRYALFINVMRCILVNTVVILTLPRIFGSDIIWYTLLIYEFSVMLLAVYLLITTEKRYNV